MISSIPEEEPTLVDQQVPDATEWHTTWPAPPLSPISSNPPPNLVVPLVPRAPALPADLVSAQFKDDSSE